MATQTLRIGSIDGLAYNDAVHNSAIETTQTIRCGAPAAANEVLRKGDMPAGGGGSDTDFTVLTAIQAGGAGPENIQYKTRFLTLNAGIIVTVGAESGWNDI